MATETVTLNEEQYKRNLLHYMMHVCQFKRPRRDYGDWVDTCEKLTSREYEEGEHYENVKCCCEKCPLLENVWI